MDSCGVPNHIHGMDTEPDNPTPLPVPADPLRNEETVRRGFWSKLRANLGRVPFAEDLVASYYAATDPATPARSKAVLLGALAYFVMPLDAMPDFIALLGFTDDAAVLALAIQTVRANLRPDHYEKARAALKDGGADAPDGDHHGREAA